MLLRIYNLKPVALFTNFMKKRMDTENVGSVSYFSLGGLELCLGRLSPPKPPVATGLHVLCI